MLRTLVWFSYLWITLLGSIPRLKKSEKLDREKAVEERDQMVNQVVGPWARKLLKLSGTTVTVKGAENVPSDRAVLFVANHQSNFDIPILLGHIDKPKAFIAKVELEKFPFINRWMKLMQCVFMDRGNMRQSAKAIMTGIKNLKSGYSMVVFPEGTRSADGALLEFKPGALKLATKSGAPIVPVTIKGSKNIMTKGSKVIKPASVEIIIDKPIEITDEIKQDTIALTEDIKARIDANLKG